MAQAQSSSDSYIIRIINARSKDGQNAAVILKNRMDEQHIISQGVREHRMPDRSNPSVEFIVVTVICSIPEQLPKIRKLAKELFPWSTVTNSVYQQTRSANSSGSSPAAISSMVKISEKAARPLADLPVEKILPFLDKTIRGKLYKWFGEKSFGFIVFEHPELKVMCDVFCHRAYLSTDPAFATRKCILQIRAPVNVTFTITRNVYRNTVEGVVDRRPEFFAVGVRDEFGGDLDIDKIFLVLEENNQKLCTGIKSYCTKDIDSTDKTLSADPVPVHEPETHIAAVGKVPVAVLARGADKEEIVWTDNLKSALHYANLHNDLKNKNTVAHVAILVPETDDMTRSAASRTLIVQEDNKDNSSIVVFDNETLAMDFIKCFPIKSSFLSDIVEFK